jgi:uncharacterized membrane protein YphA (DoxX/SURF4 family)
LKLDSNVARWVIVALRIALAGVLVWAAVPKLLDPATFATDIANYRLVPESWAGPIAVMLPVLELVIGGAILAGLEARGAAIIAAVMLVVFSVAMGQAMARGIDLECGCFGSASESEVGWTSIVRNVLLVALAAVIAYAPDVSWKSLFAKPSAAPDPAR